MTEIGAHPQRLDLTVHPGDPIALAMPVLNAAGAAQSLAGWSASATVTAPDGQLLHDFAPTISSDLINIVATSQQTSTWTSSRPAWSAYAVRFTVTATPPGGGPLPIATGWIRLYQ